MSSISKPLAIVVQMLLISGALAGLMTGAGADEGKAGGRAVTLIHDVYELQNMSMDVTANYELANDIDASSTKDWAGGKGFEPINPEFTGSLEGHGFSIRGLFIYRPDESGVGLISRLGLHSNGIKNLTLVSVTVTGRSIVGALAGNSSGLIINCHVNGTISSTNQVGGLVGESYFGSFEYCSFTGDVSGSGMVGGIVGQGSGLISECHSSGWVVGDADNVGGLIGSNRDGQIHQSYSSAAVWGWSNVGGFVGENRNSGANISDCYCTGPVTGNDTVGGFVGASNGTITRCYSSGKVNGPGIKGGFMADDWMGTQSFNYWDNQTSGLVTSADGIGKNTDDMMKKSTFEHWNFDSVWNIDEGKSYPYLRDVSSPIVNSPPTITTSPITNATADSLYSVQYQATDPDGDSLSWNMTSNASWLGMTGAGLLSGTPSSADIGTYVIAVTVSDGKGGTASITFELTVSARTHTISWTDVPGDVNLTAGDNYTFTARATDTYPEHTLVYSVNSTGNSTMTVNSTTGAIQWLNVTAGNYSFTLSATDGELAISHDFILSVAKKQEQLIAPSIISVTGPENITVKASSVQTFSVEATSPSGANLTYEWKESGVTLSTERTFSQMFPPGNHTLILLIGDGRYTTTRTFNFTVAPPPKTISAKPVSVPGFEAGIAAAAVVMVVAIGLFLRRERR